MQAQLKNLCKQALPIIVSALAAAGLAFLQALAAHWGLSISSHLSIENTGALGGIFKAGHTIYHAAQNGAPKLS